MAGYYLETDLFFFTGETNPAVTFSLSNKVISCELCATRKAKNHPRLWKAGAIQIGPSQCAVQETRFLNLQSKQNKKKQSSNSIPSLARSLETQG